MQNGENDKDKKKSKRVYKDQADKERQKKMEGKDSPFQNALRAAEKAGKKTFNYEGKVYAARTNPPAPKRMSGMEKVESRKPNTDTPTPKMDAPKRVKTQGSEKVLAKDATGNPLYQRRNKSAAKGVAKRLKKRQKQRGY